MFCNLLLIFYVNKGAGGSPTKIYPLPPPIVGNDIHPPLPIPQKNTDPSQSHYRSKVSAAVQLHYAHNPQSPSPKTNWKTYLPHIPRPTTTKLSGHAIRTNTKRSLGPESSNRPLKSSQSILKILDL